MGRRERLLPLVLCLLITAGLAGAVPAQVLIDDFSTAQAGTSLQDPPDIPGATQGTTQGGAGMIGGQRDLFLTWISGGIGPVSTSVSGGSLLFSTTADSDASVLVTWDADTDPNNLDATGLGNVDLTAGGTQSALRLTVDSADAGLELILTVYTDATDFSTSAQVLPAVGAANDFFFPFAGFVADPGGSGADFTDVGAVSLLVRGSGTNAGSALSFSAGNLETAAPAISALQGDQPGTPAAPGDTITFEATVQNTGGQGEGVTFEETLDANVTIVPGSVKTSPLARNDSFSGIGNVDIVIAAPGVLANDVDLDDPGPSSLVVTTIGAIPTAQGGTATLAADGSFTYSPPAGFQGVDGFSYSIVDDEAETDSASAVITLDAIVWFVENDACSPHPCGTGTFADPFSSLKQAETASSAGHVIRLREGDGTTLNNDQGFIKKNGQQLIGSGVDLIVNGQTIETATNRPVMTHVAGNGIDLASENTIRGLNIAGSSGAALFGTGVGTVTVTEVDVTDSGGAALDVDGGTLAMTFGTLDSLSSSGHGIHLRNVGGSLSATTTNLDDPTDTGIRVATSPGASFDFGNTTITNAGDAGGADAGIDLATSGSATFTFDSLSSTTENGAGLVANGSGTVNIGGTTNTITATGGPALDVTNIDLGTGWTFSSLTSNTSPTEGIRLDTINDPITVNTATVVNNPDTTGILVQGSPSTAFDFGPTTVFDAMVGAGNTGNGIDLLTGNTGASFTFDSLSVTTDGGFGLRSGSSTLSVGGGTNSINATGGAALDLTNTAISGTATFSSLSSSSSPGTGINLNGVTGGLTANGGSITGATGNAFDVAGGSGNVTYAGSITNSVARSVEVTGRTGDAILLSGSVNDTGAGINLAGNTGGSTTLSGASKILNTGTGNAVTISGSSGHTLAFTGGGLDIDTTSGNGFDVSGGINLDVSGGTNTITNTTTGIGFQADGGGTLNVTGNTTITSGTGSGVDIQNTDIGASGATFLSVSSSGGANPGIRLNSTGTVAGSFFSVSGAGGDCKGNAANCSGGTISAKTGIGVDVDGARDVRLAAMQIDGSGSHGIALDNVAGFTFDNSRLTNHGDAAGEQGLRGRELSGAVNLTNSHFQGNVEDHVEVLNDTNATTSTVTITGNLFAINNAASPGNNAINYASRGTVSKNITFDIRGNTFQNIRATAIQIDAERNTTHNITIGGPNAGDVNTFTTNNVALNLTNNFSGDVVALIENNDMTGHGSSGAGQVINLFTATSASTGSTFNATVRNNRIGTMGVSNSGTPNGNAVRVISQGNTAMRVLIEQNIVHGVTNGGIDAQGRDGVASLDLTLRNNDLNFEDSIGVFVAGTGDAAGETISLCADIGGPGTESNTIVNEELTAFFVFAGVTVQQAATGAGAVTFTLPNFGGGGTAAVESFIDGQNAISTPGAVSAQNVFATGTFTAGGTQCNLP